MVLTQRQVQDLLEQVNHQFLTLTRKIEALEAQLDSLQASNTTKRKKSKETS